eukprot:NODE_937_length_2933_cov_0.413550.p1 type:complete len:400 gc:universal NODE_937_length_2933_cov_0.413550:846-2045(+)
MNWGQSAKEFYINVLALVPSDMREIGNEYLTQYIRLKGPQRSYKKENLQQHLTKIKLDKFKRNNTATSASWRSSKAPIPGNANAKITPTAEESSVKIRDRMKRFANQSNEGMQQADISNSPIVGTNLNLEKGYLRLTGPPNPVNCRPLHILKQSLQLVRNKWKNSKDYSSACDQLKSIRQDLSVQGIRNEFTIEVYEFHGKIALKMQDIGEFNQSQTQLWQLYHFENISLPKNNLLFEFTAYRILYFVFTKRKTELALLLKHLTPEQRRVGSIKHACSVRKAVDMNDCYEVLKLHSRCPNAGKNLMNLFIERVRVDSLRAITRSFRKSVSMDFIAMMLGMKFEETFNFIEGLVQAVSDDNLDAVFVMGDVCSVNCADLYVYVVERCNQLSKIDIKGQIH